MEINRNKITNILGLICLKKELSFSKLKYYSNYHFKKKKEKNSNLLISFFFYMTFKSFESRATIPSNVESVTEESDSKDQILSFLLKTFLVI